jgi:uroporphyrinogen-III synthase
MRIAVTRPLEDSERTAAALRARGHEVLVAPLMQVEPVAADIRPSWGGVVITSANAVAAIAAHPAREALIKLPLYAVGKRSADAASAAGFADVTSAGGDVRDLVRLIVSRRADATGPLLYLAGEDRAADLIGELIARGIAAEMAVVYRAAFAPFPPPLISALKAGEIDAVLHFSRRSAESYLAGAGKADVAGEALALRHLCLSAQIAEPFVAAGAGLISVAKRPDEASIIALLEQAEG